MLHPTPGGMRLAPVYAWRARGVVRSGRGQTQACVTRIEMRARIEREKGKCYTLVSNVK